MANTKKQVNKHKTQEQDDKQTRKRKRSEELEETDVKKIKAETFQNVEKSPKSKKSSKDTKSLRTSKSPKSSKSPKNPKSPKSTKSTNSKKTITRKKLKQEVDNDEPSTSDGKKKTQTERKRSGRDQCTCRKLVGAHVSIKGGLHKAVNEAVEIGARSFGLFLKSQRQWAAKPLDKMAAEKFKEACRTHGFRPNAILPHGSYLVNCASPNQETLRKSRDALVDELQRCEMLGLTLYNFHPGSTCGETSVEEGIASIAQSINMAHARTTYVTTVIENMCCQGNTIGGTFEELRGIIDKVKDKSRIGVCLDTCHAFAAGFDLTTDAGFNKFVSDFGRIVGFKYLKGIHLNDSKGKKGCHQDRHESIGKGQIGIKGFNRVMSEPYFNNIPMILETPATGLGYEKEIEILHDLCDS